MNMEHEWPTMESVLRNVKKEDVQLEPFPHLDIRNALPEPLHRALLEELPSDHFLENTININSGEFHSSFVMTADDMSRYGLKAPRIKQFMEVHSSDAFMNEALKLFEDHLESRFPRFRRDLLSPSDTSMFVNPRKTRVSDVAGGESTFVRGPHTDAATDIGVFLYYLKPCDSTVTGGDLELFDYKSTFRGFRRDIWWDERELPLGTIKHVKSVPYESNRFIFVLDGINAIHGVSPTQTGATGYRIRLTGGIRTESKHYHYDYRDYLSKFGVLKDRVGVVGQKVRQKAHKYLGVG